MFHDLRTLIRSFFLCGLCVLCGESLCSAEEVRGVSLAHLHHRAVGYGSEECRKQLTAIASLGANWVALNEFAYMQAVDDPHVRFNLGRGDDEMKQAIADAHAAGLKVLLKPHVWSRQYYTQGKWAGDIKMNSEGDWDTWFAEYTDFVLRSARIAQSAGAEALCVGVEFQGMTVTQEVRWRRLIAEVRKLYRGRLTYASAFWEAPEIKFWDALDCIGIDAYYAVAEHELAGEEEIRAGWSRVYEKLVPLSKRWGKPICFTELGYTASARAGIEPWSWQVVHPDPALQARLYKVALEEAARHEQVAGVFVWKWFTSDQWKTMEPNEAFCVQDNEQVLQVLREAWRNVSTTSPNLP